MTRKGDADGVEVSIGRLPHTGSDLFGREEELGWLDRCWEEGAHVASVVAWGGVGKSALVNGWLRGMMREGWRGAERVYAWSFYSQGTTDRVVSADEFVSAALRWFGDADPTAGSPWDKGERLAGYVKKQRALLVLDGLEPLQWGPGAEEGKIKDPSLEALIRELGAQNKGMLLITSRIHVRDLDDFIRDKNPQLDLDHLSAEAGAQVLRARGVKGAAEELREAVEEYEGHSLALTLLGSYLRKAHKGDIRRWREVGPLEEKHTRRIMIAYEGWFQGKPELAILRMLGLFDRPADEGEISALKARPSIVGLTTELDGIETSRWNEALTALRDVGLLTAEGEEEPERLDTHPLVREHFGEALRKTQPEAWREGHRRLYEHLKGKAKELPETVEEMGPLYAAVVHGCRAGRPQEALDEVYWTRIQRGNDRFNSTTLGTFGAELGMLTAFFDSPWSNLAPGLKEADEAIVLYEVGFALSSLGRLKDATRPMVFGLEKALGVKDWALASSIAGDVSELHLTRGAIGEAVEVAEKAVELADLSRDASERMVQRTTLADVLHMDGRLDDARKRFEEAELMAKEMGLPSLSSVYAFRHWDFLHTQGRAEDVLDRARAALEVAMRDKYMLLVALAYLCCGRARLIIGFREGSRDLISEACAELDAAVTGLRNSGQQDYLPYGLLARAELHLTTDPARAQTDLDESLALSTRCDFRLHEADTHLLYARLHLTQGTLAEARPHLTKARSLIEATGYHRRDQTLTELEATLTAAERLLPVPVPAPAPEQTTAPRPPRPAPGPARPPARPRFRQHLARETITVLHATAVQLGLADVRPTLLSGMHPGFTASLPTSASPSALLSTDLDTMNAIERLADGTVPLRSWIESALRIASHRTEARVFQDALDALPAHEPDDEG